MKLLASLHSLTTMRSWHHPHSRIIRNRTRFQSSQNRTQASGFRVQGPRFRGIRAAYVMSGTDIAYGAVGQARGAYGQVPPGPYPPTLSLRHVQY
eukprot:1404333-Rhodomonas_salina.2